MAKHLARVEEFTNSKHCLDPWPLCPSRDVMENVARLFVDIRAK